uniref:Regulating synaptic membrane exocytosis protein 2 n=1 Tax=Schistocephalus solidus TaxID=70667 RepID=A0A0X3PFM6_SCHSO
MQPARVKPVNTFDRRPHDKVLMAPNMAADNPDLSHLTPEERRIIEDVMSRQRQEELQNEQAVRSRNLAPPPCNMVRRGSQVFQRLPANRQQVTNPARAPSQFTIATQLPNPKRQPTAAADESLTPLRCKDEFFGGLTRIRRPPHETSPAIPRHSKVSGDLLGTITGFIGHESQGDCCEVCQTTKFADNAGHHCAHCNRRTCIRCGGYFGPESSWFCRDCFSQFSVPSPSSVPMSDASTAVTSSTASKVRPPARSFVSDSQSDGSQKAMLKPSAIGYAGVANRTIPHGAGRGSHRSVSDEEKTWSYVNQYPAVHGHEISPPPPPPRMAQSNLGPRRQSMYYRLGRPLDDDEFEPYPRTVSTTGSSRERALTNDGGMLDPRMRQPRHRPDGRPISETSSIPERGLTELSPRLSGHCDAKVGSQLSHRRDAFSSEGSESPLGSHGAFSSSSAAEDQQREMPARYAGQHVRRLPVDAGSVSEPCKPDTYLKHSKMPSQLERFQRHSSVVDRPGLKRSSFWSPSTDGESLIGQVYLRCPRESSDVGLLSSFGLKLVIGKRMPSDLVGTFISHVQEGSVADVVGSLQVGDEILEWNGHSLRGLHQEQVSEVLALSCESSDVWMIVQRIFDDYYAETRPATPTSCAYNCNEEQNESEDDGTAYAYGRNDYDPHLQLKLRYSEEAQTLNVCVLSARDLPPLFDKRNRLSSSFCQVCVLPESSKAVQQFTRIIPETNNPVWVHTFTYKDFSREDVNTHELEVAVFDSRNGRVALVGEVLIDLSVADLSGRAYWYPIPQVWNSSADPDVSSQVTSETGGFQQGKGSPTAFSTLRHLVLIQ